VPDGVASDHGTVTTHRARVTAVGRTGRVQVQLPASLGLEVDTVVWCSLGGEAGYAAVTTALDGSLVLAGVARNRRRARQGHGQNRLATFLDAAGIEPGDPLELDELTSGHAYGLRPPGVRVVYTPPDQRADSLADIARDLIEDA